VMGFTSHQQMHGEPPGRIVGCSHFSRQHYMVIGPHHAAVTHAGGSSEGVGQREHMVRLGIHRKCWSEFLCLGGYLAPPRQVGGCAPRDALGRHPSAVPRRWRPAGGPVAGAQLGIDPLDHQTNVISRLLLLILHTALSFYSHSNIPNLVPTNQILSALRT
jgi:hypothetical protein